MSPSAVVLAAGRGTRIAPVTSGPKCLLEVCGKSLVHHHVEHLEALGFGEVVIVVGHQKELVERHLADCASRTTIRFVENEDVDRFGNAASLTLGLEQVSGPCIAIDGDLIYELEVLERFLAGGPDGCVLVGEGDINDVECAKTVTDRHGRVRAVVDKRALLPDEQDGFLGEAIGVLMFTEQGRTTVLHTSEQFLAAAGNLIENWEHLLNASLHELPLATRFVETGRWIEIDTPQDYAQARQIFERSDSAIP